MDKIKDSFKKLSSREKTLIYILELTGTSSSSSTEDIKTQIMNVYQ